MKSVIVVSATKELTMTSFYENTKLGKSLRKQLMLENVDQICVTTDNKIGLSEIYNKAIKQYSNDGILLFVHDDVSLEDAFLKEKLNEGLERFDIVGLAGTSQWSMKKSPLVWNNSPRGAWSGAVAHNVNGETFSTAFGPMPRKCLLVDGLFMAADSKKLTESGILFNEDFNFHFYDLSFCIEAYKKKLSVGTWPIWVVHDSPGDYRQSKEWHESERVFKEIYGTNT